MAKSILIFILAASTLNAHAVLKSIYEQNEEIIDVMTMKKRIILQLLEEHAEHMDKRATIARLTATNSADYYRMR